MMKQLFTTIIACGAIVLFAGGATSAEYKWDMTSGYAPTSQHGRSQAIFEKLVENANNQLDPDADQQDFFAIFGKREAENIRKSADYTMRGLGNKGLGKTEIAKTDLEKAVELMISGFCREVFTELPLEFAAEADRLLTLKLEGSVG